MAIFTFFSSHNSKTNTVRKFWKTFILRYVHKVKFYEKITYPITGLFRLDLVRLS